MALDNGERHLLAWLFSNLAQLPQKFGIATADKAALKAANDIDLLENAVSLEKLAREAGVDCAVFSQLAGHYRADWLSKVKCQVQQR